MIPKKVTICGIPHTITLCEDKFDIDTHFGQIRYGKADIRISKDVTPELQEQTLFHEILHGLLALLGYCDQSNDEQFVQALSTAMYQTFALKQEEES